MRGVSVAVCHPERRGWRGVGCAGGPGMGAEPFRPMGPLGRPDPLDPPPRAGGRVHPSAARKPASGTDWTKGQPPPPGGKNNAGRLQGNADKECQTPAQSRPPPLGRRKLTIHLTLR